jgi:hypothetical protein
VRSLVVTAALAVAISMNLGFIISLAASAPRPGFGTPIGKVGPCPATTIDESTLPLIVTLLRSGVPYARYNVSADPGTIWYHFDVPAGRYQIVTTYTGTRNHSVTVDSGKSVRTDLTLKCITNHF